MNCGVLCVCVALGLSAGQAPETQLPPPAASTPALISVPEVPIPIGDFARGFQPAPGTYNVLFLHPVTCCPVRVCFTLPCGCPRVICSGHTLTFHYQGRHRVVIRFKILRGGVVVREV